MKIILTEGEKQADALNRIVWHSKVSRTDNEIIDIIRDNGLTKEVITEKPSNGEFEFVIVCVRNCRAKVLDYIYENSLASPNFVSCNGSHTILFAMQSGYDTFACVIANGGTFVDGDDFVSNPSLELTSLKCSGNSNDILRVLCNAVMSRPCITNSDTVNAVIQYSVRMEFKPKYIAYLLKRVSVSDTVRLQILNYAFSKRCADHSVYLNIVKGMSEKSIRRSVIDSSKTTHRSVHCAFMCALGRPVL